MNPTKLRGLEEELRKFSVESIDLPPSHLGGEYSLSPAIKAAMGTDCRPIPSLMGQCSLGEFHVLWSIGLPLLVKDSADLQCYWSPSTLAKVFGRDMCELVDCEDEGFRESCHVDNFLQTRLSIRHGHILKLKVRAALRSLPGILKDHTGLSIRHDIQNEVMGFGPRLPGGPPGAPILQ
ncbi:hypothetical protein AB1N83_014434 [Pleurotus pulmonarius]